MEVEVFRTLSQRTVHTDYVILFRFRIHYNYFMRLLSIFILFLRFIAFKVFSCFICGNIFYILWLTIIITMHYLLHSYSILTCIFCIFVNINRSFLKKELLQSLKFKISRLLRARLSLTFK